jgi:hypothetical protein
MSINNLAIGYRTTGVQPLFLADFVFILDNKSTTTAPHVEQEHTMSSPPVFSGVRVSRSLIVCVMVCISLFVFCPFSCSHCIVCSD